MVVRVRLQPLWEFSLAVVADLLILVGIGGMLVWLWGLSEGAVYQYTQNAHFSREAAGGDFGIAGTPAVVEASPQSGVPAWIAPALPKRDPLLLGHRDTFFRPLRGITQGDPIRVKTRNGSFRYVVDLIQVVPPEQSLTFQEAMPAKSLTLITCFPFDYVGPAPRRFVVRARIRADVNRSELDPPVHTTSVESSSLEKMP